MLDLLAQKTNERTAALFRFLSLSEACDHAMTEHDGAFYKELKAFDLLVQNPTEEKVFRHCSIINQLYSIYENFAEAIVEIWLSKLPKYTTFASLSQEFQSGYRHRISQILQDITKRRYSHLNTESILESYLGCLKNNQVWELVGDAFTTHEANLRRQELEKMFSSCGLTGLWPWLESNARLEEARSELDPDKSLEQLLEDFVDYRNKASHGRPDEILSSTQLRRWMNLIIFIFDALTEFITHRLFSKELEIDPEFSCGVVTEALSHNISVLQCSHGKFRVGQTLFFFREKDLVKTTIESLQENSMPKEEILVCSQDFEVGVKTSKSLLKVTKGAKVIILNKSLF